MRAHFSCQRWRCVSRCACANHKCRGRARRKATRSRLRRRRDATDRTWARKRVRESRREGVGSRKEFVHCDESAHTNTHTHTHTCHTCGGVRDERTNEQRAKARRTVIAVVSVGPRRIPASSDILMAVGSSAGGRERERGACGHVSTAKDTDNFLFFCSVNAGKE
jgi:hypothetical protein